MIRKQYRATQADTLDIKREIKILVGVVAFSGACIFGQIILEQAKAPEAVAYNLATDRGIPGKGEDGKCMDYALALSSRLAASGIHGRLIFYSWQQLGALADDGSKRGAHVFVSYTIGGQRWVVDNEMAEPVRVAVDASVAEQIKSLGQPSNIVVAPNDSLNRLSFF